MPCLSPHPSLPGTPSTRRQLLRQGSLCLLALFLSAGFSTATAAAAQALQGVVTWVYDADTLEVQPHGKVRLLGIDAPEQAATDRDRTFIRLGIAPNRLRNIHKAGIAYGLRHVKGQTVTLSSEAPGRDRHGRLLAYVYLPDGRLLNRLLLEEGLVIVYRRFEFQFKTDFLAAEVMAQARGVGLWAR